MKRQNYDEDDSDAENEDQEEKTIADMQVTDDDMIHFDFLERGIRLLDNKKREKFDEIDFFIKNLNQEMLAAVNAKYGKDAGANGKKYAECFMASNINAFLEK